ncbi:PHP domain-containing protein [Clostridium sp.]|uniref:PHP domain-containing protein n=1 Tax=Clostridium sp. TaxID=1506 RepID=UPI0026DCA4E5|nr:PHP domain-containing protein [Clostridium sp.]MDO5039229.1 PHP domain-containing protein [Clostridium sp.]
MKRTDFHVHTNFSDGILSPKNVIDRAKKNNVSILAITDHDTVDGIIEAISVANDKDIKLIPGIELSCNYNNESIHLLGFFKDDSYKSQELSNILNEIKNRRIIRAKNMIEKLKEKFDINIDFNKVSELGGNIIARPHIARAIIDAGYPYTQDYIFDNFIGKDKPAYIPTTKISLEEGIEILHKFNAITVLAHPILIKNTPLEEFLKFKLDGIEAIYYLNSKEQEKYLISFAKKNNLLITAGSDCHGDFINDDRHGDIGDMKLSEEDLSKFLKALNFN